MVIERRAGELGDGLRDIVAGSLNRDIVVLLKVDTGGLVLALVGDTEELTLHPLVGGTGNVLAIDPSTLTSTTAESTAAVGRTVGVGVEVAGRTGRRGKVPTTATSGSVAGVAPTVGRTAGSSTGSARFIVSTMPIEQEPSGSLK